MSHPTILLVSEPSELLKYLVQKFPERSRTVLKSILGNGQVEIGNKVVTQFNYALIAGDQILVHWQKRAAEPTFKGISIIYEDADLLVIDKNVGVLSIATDKEKENTAYSMLSAYVKMSHPKNRIFVIHRLDRETSGVMMYAKNLQTQQSMQSSWKETVSERTYVALVEGMVGQQKGSVRSKLIENKANMVFSNISGEQGKDAITHYEVIKQNAAYSLLKVNLETGRKNQIRVHMKDLGHSIVGDRKYGAKLNPINRMGLHAHILVFTHPTTGKLLSFQSPVPKTFTQLMR